MVMLGHFLCPTLLIPWHDEAGPMHRTSREGKSGRYGKDETNAVCDFCWPSAASSIWDLLHCPGWNYNYDEIESGEVRQFC